MEVEALYLVKSISITEEEEEYAEEGLVVLVDKENDAHLGDYCNKESNQQHQEHHKQHRSEQTGGPKAAKTTINLTDIKLCSSNYIVQYNKLAVDFFFQGDFVKCRDMFLEAAQEWSDNARKRLQMINNTCSAAIAIEENDTVPSSCTSTKTIQTSTSLASCSISTCDPNQQQKELNIYDLIDEKGIHVFLFPLEIRAESDPILILATLLFNAGQAQSKCQNSNNNPRNGDIAYQYYQSALDTLLPFIAIERTKNGENTCSGVVAEIRELAIPLLHNLGRLSYTRGLLEESIAFYEFALEECQQFYLEQQNVSSSLLFQMAATLNCLGTILGRNCCINTNNVLLHPILIGDENDDNNKGNSQIVTTYQLSLQYLQQSLELFVRLFGGKDNKDGSSCLWVATVLNNLGHVYATNGEMGELSTALFCFEQAAKIIGEEHGSSNQRKRQQQEQQVVCCSREQLHSVSDDDYATETKKRRIMEGIL